MLVSGRDPGQGFEPAAARRQQLDAALNPIRAAHPSYDIAVTGLAVIAARNSAAMIEKLNRGLTLEFLFVAVFIGLAFRSVIVMLASILPGIFPVVLSGNGALAVRARACSSSASSR